MTASRLAGFTLTLVLALVYAGTAAANHATVPVTVVITHIEDLDSSLDDGTGGEPDFYDKVLIDGTEFNSFSSHVDDNEHVHPNWTYTKNVARSVGTANVFIQIWDHDDCDTPYCTNTGFGLSNDDAGDVNPAGDQLGIDLTIDLRTGATAGDAAGPCSDGNDEERKVRVCWTLSIPPEYKDADGDGLFDVWETTGIDVNDDGTIDLDLAALGAEPDRKDIFIELDYMEFHRPRPEAIADTVAAFAAAPVTNPDGTGIDLHVEVDEQVAHDDDIAMWGDFDTIKAASFGTAAQRTGPNAANVLAAKKLLYQYSLWVHTYDGTGSSGLAEGANDFIVSLGGWTANDAGTHTVGSRIEQSGTFMHELGHNLGFGHGGGDGINCKPNYVSIMSYSLQTILIPGPGSTQRLDYSRADLDDLDEGSLVEGDGIGDGTDFTFWSADGGANTLTGQGNGALDWDGDGTTDPGAVAVDLNDRGLRDCGEDGDGNDAPTPDQTLPGWDDWANLRYSFAGLPDAADGVHTAPKTLELDVVTAALIRQQYEQLFAPKARPGGPYAAAEGGSISVDGSGSTDIDDGPSALTYLWSFGDGTTGAGPNVTHVYGDDGVYTVTLTVTDPGGLTGTASTTAVIWNVAPTASLSSAGAVSTAGGLAFLGRAGAGQSHAATGTDVGSDDLTFAWSAGTTRTYFNNGSSPDPLLSPGGTYPFSASDTGSVSFALPGLYTLQLTLSDDDGGTATQSLPKLVTGNERCTRPAGFWKHEVGSGNKISDATLVAYLKIVEFASGVFAEQAAVLPLSAAADVFAASSDPRKQARAELLAAWLNFAAGGVGWSEPVNTHGGGSAKTPFNAVVAAAEAIVLNGSATKKQLTEAWQLAQSINVHRQSATC